MHGIYYFYIPSRPGRQGATQRIFPEFPRLRNLCLFPPTRLTFSGKTNLHCAQVLSSCRRNDFDQLHLAGGLARCGRNTAFDAHAPQAGRLNRLEISPLRTVRNAG